MNIKNAKQVGWMVVQYDTTLPSTMRRKRTDSIKSFDTLIDPYCYKRYKREGEAKCVKVYIGEPDE